MPKTNYSLKLADDKQLLNASRAGETKQDAVPERPAVQEVAHNARLRQTDRSGNDQGKLVSSDRFRRVLPDHANS